MTALRYLTLFALLSFACSKSPKQLTLLSPQSSGVDFTNAIDEKSVNILDYVNMYNGSGVAVADFNNDGFQDIVFGGNMVSSQLYLNTGNSNKPAFKAIDERSGFATNKWVNGVTTVDINQDGLVDIYCSIANGKGSDRGNLLFINEGVNESGIPTFRESAKPYGIADTTHTIQSAFFDYDLDGDLDLFMIVNYPVGYLDAEANRIVSLKKIGDRNRTDRLFRNEGNSAAGHPTFTEVSVDAGITLEGYSLGLAITDINGDYYPDIYVANDYVTNDIFYINNGDGTFTDNIRNLVNHTSYSSMGIDIADTNNDGLQDILVVDMLPEKDDKMKLMYAASHNISHEFMQKSNYVDQYFRNTLQLNNGTNRGFSEIGQMAGVFRTNWSWSALMPDIDMDGWRDVFITNGFTKDVNDLDFINYQTSSSPFERQGFDGASYVESLEDQQGIHLPNYIFRNEQDLTYSNQSASWGFEDASYSNGASYADLDNDGDLDLVISNINAPAFVYQNNASANWVEIELHGEKPNLRAIGAKVSFECSAGIQSHENYLTRGFMSAISPVMHFGVGVDTVIRDVTIRWPDGSFQTYPELSVNKKHHIYKEASPPPTPKTTTQPILNKAPDQLILAKHDENYFNDFDHQRLLPHKLSQAGPCLAVGDANGDGLEDVYMGGSKGFPGQLLFNEGSSFRPMPLPDSEPYEDGASLWLDVDGDNDLDLYVASGGVAYGKKNRYYEDRLYLNEGSDFVRYNGQLPSVNTSAVLAADFDQDGDLDLFVGGASKPNEYPLSHESYLLINESTPEAVNFIIEPLGALGIIKSALWSDYNNDGWEDLFVVGEYTPIIVFKNEAGALFRSKDIHIPEKTGMWNSITGTDIDQDGDMDYILGNMGLNSRFKASPEEPLRLYASDFDGNGEIDPIMTQIRDGREVPVHLRDDLIRQLVKLKKTVKTYEEYAKATIHDLFSEQSLDEATKLTCTFLHNALLINNGTSGFSLEALPNAAQTGPIYGSLTVDLSATSSNDIVLVGNSFAQEIFSGWQDAFTGSVVNRIAAGQYETMTASKSGIFLRGDAKALVKLKMPDDRLLLVVSQNNDSLKTYLTETTFEDVLIADPMENYALISYNNGKTERRELPYGSSYFSQSSRSIAISAHVSKVSFYKHSRLSRTLRFD